MFGVSKKIKVTTLYVTKVIYSVVIFMLQCGYEFNKSEVKKYFKSEKEEIEQSEVICGGGLL